MHEIISPNIRKHDMHSRVCKMRTLLDQYHRVSSRLQSISLGNHSGAIIWNHPAAELSQVVMMENQMVNTLSLGINGRHFADDIFKCSFFNETIFG